MTADPYTDAELEELAQWDLANGLVVRRLLATVDALKADYRKLADAARDAQEAATDAIDAWQGRAEAAEAERDRLIAKIEWMKEHPRGKP